MVVLRERRASHRVRLVCNIAFARIGLTHLDFWLELNGACFELLQIVVIVFDTVEGGDLRKVGPHSGPDS